jgi:hypothetical protein
MRSERPFRLKTELRFVTVGDLQARLAEYEKRYGIPSDRLVDAFTTDGELQETEDFHAWSALYAAFQASTAKPRSKRRRRLRIRLAR